MALLSKAPLTEWLHPREKTKRERETEHHYRVREKSKRMKDNELIVVDIHLYFQTPRVWQSICGRVNPWQWPDKHKQAGTDLLCWNITPSNIPKYSCSHIQIHIVHRVAEKCFNKTIFKLIYFLYISLMVMTPHHLYIYIMVSSYGTADVFFSSFFSMSSLLNIQILG